MTMLTTRTRPTHDTVIYDGHCRFCRSQIALLRWVDLRRKLRFVSLHDAAVSRDYPELSPDDLVAQMYVIDPAGHARGGAEAVRYLTRQLVLLWPLALVLHIPGTMPLWSCIYRFIAKNRMLIAGSCADGSCKLPK
jgi:predicted DCC family thiol-disulfide oxidoreductase YuxK